MAVTRTPVWSPSSWRAYPALHQPEWPSEERAEAARGATRGRAAARLRRRGAPAAGVARRGGGRPSLPAAGGRLRRVVPRPVSAIHIREKLKIMLQMAAVLTYGATLPVVKVGRIAGQFAKARTSPTETVGGVEIPSFRGHMVHDDAPTAEARIPDPDRMVQAYHHATATLNLLRAFTKGGFADLLRVHEWNQEFVASLARGPPLRAARHRDRARAPLHGRVRDRPRRPSSSSTRWTSGRATRASCSTTRRRSRAATRPPATGTTARRTCSGSGSARASSTARTSSSSPACTTRSGVKVGPDGDRRRARSSSASA